MPSSWWERERRRNRPATALGVLDGRLKGDASRDLHEQRIELLVELGWANWAERERSWLLIRYPVGYPPF